MKFTRDMDKGDQLRITKTIRLDPGMPVAIIGNCKIATIIFHEKTGRKARISVEADKDFQLSRVTDDSSTP